MVSKPLEHLPLAGQRLGTKNRLLLDYWQSLRQADAHGLKLPSRSDFNPRQVQGLLSTLFLFQVWPDEGVACRVAGTTIARTLGLEMTGKNYLDLTPTHFRGERLRRFTAYTRGTVSRAYRKIGLDTGEHYLVEELALPFGDVREDGSIHVIVHVDGPDPDAQAHAVDLPRILGAPAIHEIFAP